MGPVSPAIAERMRLFPPSMKRGTAECARFSMAVKLTKAVAAHHNNDASNNTEQMKVIKIKEALSQWEKDEQIYFILFDAKMTPKDGKESWETSGRSVLSIDVRLGGPNVVYTKLGPLQEDITKWTKKRPGRRVLYSESKKKIDTAESMKKMDTADSDDKEEDVESDIEDTDDHTDDDDDTDDDESDADSCEPPDSKRVSLTPKVDFHPSFEFILGTTDPDTHYDLRKVDVSRPIIKEFALEAVARYNDQKGCDKMVLEEIKEAFSRYVSRLEYHINFDAGLIDKEGQKTKQTSYQAVVSQNCTGPKKVWFFREGNGKDKWCNQRNCLCVFPPYQRPSTEELLKSKYREWCLSPDNEEGEDEKMKSGSSKLEN